MAAIYSRSSRCERRPRRSCVAAETGRGLVWAKKASATSLGAPTCRPPRPANGRISSAPPGVDFVRRSRISFPMAHRSGIQRSLGNDTPSGLKSRAPTEIPLRRQAQLTLVKWKAPQNFRSAGITISTLRVDDIRLCRTISTPAAWTIFASRGSQTMKPRNLFGFGASFTLAAIYSRGTCRPTTIDVLMFHFRVRNGSGWGHQAMTTRLLLYFVLRVLPYFVLPTSYFVLQFVWLSSAFLGCCCGWQTGIRVAFRDFCFPTCCAFFLFDYFF